jgi:uncharacterized heparinase superfamily protein
MLSFELSLHGRRVLVNTGTSTYNRGPERERQRSTAAHNSVVVDNQSSSEVWDRFRVARRARPLDVTWGTTGSGLSVEASHDGYHRLAGRVTHRRHWALTPDSLVIDDCLVGHFSSACALWHLPPDVRASVDQRTGIVSLRAKDGLSLQFSSGQSVLVKPSTWHHGFGQAADSTVLVTPFAGQSLVTRVTW